MTDDVPKVEEKKGWLARQWDESPELVLIVGFGAYMILSKTYPEDHIISVLKRNIVWIIIGFLAWLFVDKWWASRQKQKVRHPVNIVKKNVQDYYKENEAVTLNIRSMSVDELRRGTNIMLVYEFVNKIGFIYDPNAPFPHIMASFHDDHFEWKYWHERDKLFEEYARKFLFKPVEELGGSE